MKLKNGIDIVSMEQRQARVRLSAPFGAADIRPAEQLVAKLKAAGVVSQWSQSSKNDNFNFENIGDVVPTDGDYIYVNFRALSKTVVPGHWIDWTRDNVLEDSVQLLKGATVYANHNFYDINGWLGAVAQSSWDAVGAGSENVPGINAQYKIDALMNPRIARGLMMTPPAIHSTSMTVLFEFEYSHPDMAAEDRWKFFRNLGEEIDGEIVRLIVTKINEYWEASLVFQGADRLAKKQDDDETDDDFAEMSAKAAEEEEQAGMLAAPVTPPNSNEEKTMNIPKEKRTELGIEFDGDDVPETELLKAAESLAGKLAAVDSTNIAELTARAVAGDALVEKQRAEVTRLAKLAELGAADGDLDEVITEQIAGANVDTLVKLESFYTKKVGNKFPAGGKSSLENSDEIDNAGGTVTDEAELPEAGLL